MPDTSQAHNAAAIHQITATRLNGAPDSLAAYEGRVLLIVNVASLCGRTPQYAGLQHLYDTYEPRQFSVLGFPCNQFGDEEPGSAEEIAAFCRTSYGVTFPMFSKIDVNGPKRHPLYKLLTAQPYDDGPPGDIAWNFEKFLIGRDGTIQRRFRYTVPPSAPEVVAALEAAL